MVFAAIVVKYQFIVDGLLKVNFRLPTHRPVFPLHHIESLPEDDLPIDNFFQLMLLNFPVFFIDSSTFGAHYHAANGV